MPPLSPERRRVLEEFLRSLDIEPRAGELDLIEQSLTHRSFAHEAGTSADNERLEFLGDAVVELVVSQEVYERFRECDEGRLSKARAAVVSRKSLGACARELGFGPVIRLGRGEARHSGAMRQTILGGALEAFAGALYLARGYEWTAGWLRRRVLPLFHAGMSAGLEQDYKSRLQEFTQAQFACLPHYEKIEESGPDHAKSFVIEVLVRGERMGIGEGRRLKEAQNNAARQALEAYGVLPPPAPG